MVDADPGAEFEQGFAEEAIGQVAARRTHDLNDQLAVICGYASLGQATRGETAKTDSYFAAIASAGREARQLMGDLAALELRSASVGRHDKPVAWPKVVAPGVEGPVRPATTP